MSMRGKQILARAIEILKEIGGNHAFFRDNEATVILKNSKIQSNIWHFFQIEALVSLKNAWLRQIFFSVLLSSRSFKPRKYIPVLVGITQRKPEFLEMRRTYAQ